MNLNIITCGQGWKKLYLPIIDKIFNHDSKQKRVEDKIGIDEIKEKYGMISIKTINPHNITDEINDMINDANKDSLNVCEFCGTTENVGVTMNFWYKTCCYDCWKKEILSKQPQSAWKGKQSMSYKKS